MKTVTLFRNGEHVKVPVLFSIFDMNNSLLAENFETEAKDANDAIKKYNPNLKVKRSGSKYAGICVSKFFIDDGARYKYGKRVWYETC
jgi:hypothetical protein